MTTDPETAEIQKLLKEGKTKTDIFASLLEKCPDIETAKIRIPDIAKKLEVSTALGRKALRRVTKFQEEAPPYKPEEVSIKIPQAPTEAITEEAPQPPTAEAEVVTEAPAPPTPEAPQPPIIQTLTPILERSVRRLFNVGIDIATGYKGKEILTDEESKDTATLLPIIIYRFTKVTLTEDQFIDMTTGTHFVSIVLKVIREELKARREQRAREEEDRKKPPTPEAPAKVEPPQAEESKPTEPETTKEERPEGRQLLSKIK